MEKKSGPAEFTASGAGDSAKAGCTVGFMVIGVGTLLCLTGIGALFGIPLVIYGFMMPGLGVAGELKGDNRVYRGPCPGCNEPFFMGTAQQVRSCRKCNLKMRAVTEGESHRFEEV